MAVIFLTLNDFKGGKYNIPDASSVTSAKVQEMIDRYEKEKIYDLLGVTLGDLIITYKQASSPPPNADYDKIIGSFASDVTNGCGSRLISQGMKEYLKAAVFYEYVKNGLILAQAGSVNPKAESATSTTAAENLRFAENKFNDILNTVEAIQWYILLHSSAFPDFNGKRIAINVI